MRHNIQQLLNTLPQQGSVSWIGLRTEKRTPIQAVNSVTARTDIGLEGDRYSGRSGKRQVTLMQKEHLSVIAQVLGRPQCEPDLFKRNIVVESINLLSLKDKRFQIGTATLEYTGLCHPCSYMEQVLGPGGYNAVRGHGGITAKVIENGIIQVNDSVTAILSDNNY